MNWYPYASSIGKPVFKWPPPNRENIEHLLPPVMPNRDRAIWASAPYVSELPTGVRPDYPTLDYHRGNFQFDLPGAPLVPGGFAIWPSLLMTWFIDRLPTIEWQVKALDYYVGTLGMTHINFSRRHSENAGKTPDQFADLCSFAKSYNLKVTTNLFSGDGETWEDMQVWLDALRKRNAVDIIVNCWQGDQNFNPYNLTTNQFKILLYCVRNGLYTAMHWINGQCLWLNAKDDPARPNTYYDYGMAADDRFYAMKQQGLLTQDTVDKVKKILGNEYQEIEGHPFNHFHYYQCDTEIAISSVPGFADVQGGLTKVLESIQYSPTQWPKLVFGEYCAEALSRQLAPAPRTINQEAIKGYLGCCVSAYGRHIHGFFNDATFPDGRIL